MLSVIWWATTLWVLVFKNTCQLGISGYLGRGGCLERRDLNCANASIRLTCRQLCGAFSCLPIEDSVIPRQVVLDCLQRKLSKPGATGQWVAFLDGLCFSFTSRSWPAWVLPQNFSSDGLGSGYAIQINAFPPRCLLVMLFITAIESKEKQEYKLLYFLCIFQSLAHNTPHLHVV